ncbi:MAG: ABC transporter ATP-binding protein [Synechococcus sp. SB0673_bin_10]|nr:ABC transporter ATP-binding protein [Cyanobacteria bacterium MAG IRC3_bin_20]MCY3654240.1 ABC transporter ATP-binding protein [Cyanobacteria bacterium MAG IRC1_bin_28]MXW11477.1 ABC transporter ATP-binding protein [Synechococcus sp. SB0668_bin_13]MXY19093.1 ABC transporter ATP-binding protein [Synechococcus sp. SB0664_bin_36]MYG63998.1 ABC transporter ATP-binding protein [Synechococcus sp. SB0675_bin_7]MYI72453.1 ABC transporter ATP-binding protein [Synechococcus sp. SB0673_bin_10]MYK85928
MSDPFLLGEAITCGYGDTNILHGCTISVEKGEIAVIVGPNGAGKSTAMKAVFGLLTLREGSVRLGGQDISTLTPPDRVAAGMGFVPQTNNVFPSLTVRENLEMGAYLCPHDIEARIEQLAQLFPILQERSRQPAGELSGGQRQQVAVARAMMTQPKVLMLDEPTAGVSPILVQELFARIQEIAAAGIAVLIVEQNARQALSLADKGFVLVQGKNRFTGTGRDLLNDPDVRQSFLGGG